MKEQLKLKSTTLGIHIQGIDLSDALRNKLEYDISHVINKLLYELDAVYRHDVIRRIHEIDIKPPLKPPFPYGIMVNINSDEIKLGNIRHEVR